MTVAFALRFVTLVFLVLVGAPSLFGAWAARGTSAMQPLLAVAVLAGSAVYAQVSLLGTPATSRTWTNLGASVVVIALLIWGVLDGPDPEPVQIPPPAIDPLGALPLATRELIYRHPDLLVAFERWHRTHREDTP